MSVNKVNSDGSLSRVAGGTLYADSPIGTILAFGGANAPAGWMICDGTSLLRASYPELFAVIGTAFGSGDGSTTFNLPDMRESVPKGAGLTGKTVGNHLDADGLAVGEFLEDRVQEHNHDVESSASTGTASRMAAGGAQLSGIRVGTNSTGRHGVTTEVKSVGVNYIIKAKMVALPADFLAKVDEVVEENLAVETITGTGTTGLGFTAKKSGNVVTVYLYCTADVSGGQSLTFGVLPTGYRPPRNVKFLIHSNNGSLDSTQGMFVDISSYNGGIASYAYVALVSGACGAVTYIVD